jgi:hypothetical protein
MKVPSFRALFTTYFKRFMQTVYSLNGPFFERVRKLSEFYGKYIPSDLHHSIDSHKTIEDFNKGIKDINEFSVIRIRNTMDQLNK